jgi:hypothetical protein
MTAETKIQAGHPAQACHEMLLRLAGTAPDDLVTRCRGWLADGQLETLALAVVFYATSANAALATDDLALLTELLDASDAGRSGLHQIETDDFDPFPCYRFAAEITPSSGPDRAEQALVKVMAAESGAAGAWRAWRLPGNGSAWPAPKRIFVVEVGQGTDQIAVTARLQQELSAARETDPQVEVYQTGQELRAYHRLVREHGELIWAAAEDPGIEFAGVFDSVDTESGPRFDPDHSKLDEEEAAKVAAYLYGGEPLLVTTATMDDIVDTTQAGRVPMSFRTDGTWIWCDAAAYYVARHQLEPDGGLLAHIRAASYLRPAVDGVAVHRALALLQGPAEPSAAGHDDR